MKITLNGKPFETQENSVFKLRKSLGFSENKTVTIKNGFALSEDSPIKDGDNVFFIEKDILPDRDSLDIMMKARLTPGVYEKIKNAKVAVAGLGGLGSSIAEALARTGVGHLHLIDFDTVEPSNLNRQRYRICHLGMAKSEATALQIKEYNPFIKVKAEKVRITAENAAEIFAEDDIICEAFDSPEAKAEMINAVLEKCPHKKIVAASGMAGLESSNTIVTKRIMKNFYLCGDGVSAAEEGRGLMAPRVDICAGHQANMVLRLITGCEEP